LGKFEPVAINSERLGAETTEPGKVLGGSIRTADTGGSTWVSLTGKVVRAESVAVRASRARLRTSPLFEGEADAVALMDSVLVGGTFIELSVFIQPHPRISAHIASMPMR